MNKLLKLLFVAIEIPALVPVYTCKARCSEFPDQSSMVAAAVDTGALPALVGAYLVAKGGESTMVTGGTLQFTAYGIYADGSAGALPDAQGNAVTLWNTSDHSVARISTRGHATAVGVGIVDIEAVIGALTASPWAVTVTPAVDPPPFTLTSPLPGSTVSFPPWIQAQNTGCNGLAPVYFGYSIDDGNGFTSGVTTSEIDAPDPTMSAGIHSIYFKSWTINGECPALSSTFAVTGSAGVGDTIPPNAISSGDLDGASEWQWNHDPGTPGTSGGSSLYPATDLTLDNAAREFHVTYSDSAGELYYLPFGSDPTATHFVYDAYVYLVDPSRIQNIEMDMNQVMSNGQTVILGTQCASGSGTWEYTTVSGSAQWNPSNILCNPKAWTANTWHHVQIASHRDPTGIATYDWVNLDGILSNFQGASGASALSLGWPPGDLVLNFQLDGAGSGSMTVDIDQLTIYRW